jgi:hypothetical protein
LARKGLRTHDRTTRFAQIQQKQCRDAAEAEPVQPPLFELHEDYRPVAERTAAARYFEPSLFSLLDT